MPKFTCRRALVLCLVALWLAATAAPAVSQERKPDFKVFEMPEAPPLPEGLNHVPDDAMGFIHVRIGDFLKSAGGKKMIDQLGRDELVSKRLKSLDKELGLGLADIESVTLLFLEPPVRQRADNNRNERPPFPFPEKTSPLPKKDPQGDGGVVPKKPAAEDGKESRGNAGPNDVFVSTESEQPPFGGLTVQPLAIITAGKALDRKKLLATHVLRRDGSDGFGDTSILFLSERSFLIGEREELAHYVSVAAGKKAKFGVATHPLRSVLELGVQPHLVVAGAQLSPALRQTLLEEELRFNPELTPLLPLLSASSAGLTVDLAQTMEVKIHVNGSNARSAGLAGEAARTALAMMELGLDEATARLKKAKAPAPADLLDLAEKFGKALASAKFEHKGTHAQIALKMDMDVGTIALGVAHAVRNMQLASERIQSQNNLKQMALGMHAYHDTYRGLPPAGLRDINDKDGKPLLSWRVAILPFIEQQPLYNQFDLTKPWDHPTNKRLIAQMPSIYVVPGSKTREPYTTYYQVFVGPGTPFSASALGNRGTPLGNIIDGTSNTLMIAEAADPVIWTKPQDMPFDPDPKAPLPKLGGQFEGGFNAAFCDAHVQFIPSTVSAETLRALITSNGGEVVPPID